MSGRVTAHVQAFNDTVGSGAWGEFSERFTDDATLAFEGVPVGPFSGRSAISAAYVAQPPTDTMTVTDVKTDGARDTVRFRWSAGGTGTMCLTWDGDLVEQLVVSFDD
ncbi:nuclear transport factor 2 family protein [Nocardioides sp.]|uniref:nuclear transport factor 2 family protein n=1 Tax=Nocardioides sp. TaxID=35761 RepID=UPI002ED4D500